MKHLISVFLSLLSISVSANSVVKSPQEKCVEAHMRVWELTPWKEEGNKKKKYMEKSRNYKNINSFIRRNIMSSMTGNC